MPSGGRRGEVAGMRPGRRNAGPRSARSQIAVPSLAAVLLAGVLLAAAPAHALGSPQGGTSSEAVVVSEIATSEKVAALTFDAGSDAGHTQEILDILDDAGIKATFFLTANWLERYPELGAAIISRGHAIGNHTKSHPHLLQLTDDEILAELSDTEESAQNACGRTTKPFFRPPFGEYDRRVASVVGEAGYGYMVLWTIDSLDWKMIPADELVHRVVDNVKPGAIVLMHVGSQTNEPEALPEIIKQLKDSGYRFDTLATLLGTRPPEGVTYYTVKAGDTLTAIARRFGVAASDITQANALKDADSIEVGAVLIIPGGSGGDGGPGPGGDQGGYGSDDGSGGSGRNTGGEAGRGHGFWAGLWAGLGRLWGRILDFMSRLFARP